MFSSIFDAFVLHTLPFADDENRLWDSKESRCVRLFDFGCGRKTNRKSANIPIFIQEYYGSQEASKRQEKECSCPLKQKDHNLVLNKTEFVKWWANVWSNVIHEYIQYAECSKLWWDILDDANILIILHILLRNMLTQVIYKCTLIPSVQKR